MNLQLNKSDIVTTPDGLAAAIQALRDDFESHNHDGNNSKTFETLIAETLSSRASLIRKLGASDSAAGLWMGLVGDSMQFNLGDANSYIKFINGVLTIKATASNLQLYDTVVDAAGNGDYTTVAAALDAGKTRIFVRNGTYSGELRWNLTNQYTQIVGESLGVSVTFADTTRAVDVTANNCYIGNMHLTALAASSTSLIQLVNTQQTTIEGCLLTNTRGANLIGGSYNNVINCFFDVTSVADTTNFRAIQDMDYSTITGCLFNMTGMNSSLTALISDCQYSRFSSCLIVSNQAVTFGFTNSVESTMTNSYITAYGVTVGISMIGCMLNNNGTSPTAFVLIDDPRMRFESNYVVAPDDPNVTIFNIKGGQQSVVMGNIFKGGGKISLCNADPPSADQKGINFAWNTWRGNLGSATGTMALTSGAHFVSSNLMGNTIIDNGATANTPTITDGGSLNNVLYNFKLP